MSEHARLAPSSAHRWLECPGSITLEDPLPDVTSEHADRGTICHTIIAEHLPVVRATRQTSVAHLIGRKFKGEVVELEIDDQYADALQSCGQCALDHSLAAPMTVSLIEQRIAFPGRDDIWGTSDLGVLDIPLRRLSVIDWKFGVGVRVFARENPQAIIYAIGMLMMFDLLYDVDRVRIVIHQPLLGHHDEWEISVDELRAWIPRILAGAHRTDVERNTYKDGDWCLFCKAKAICPQLRSTALALAKREFTRIDTASNDELAEAMAQIPRIQAVIRAVEAETLKRLANGEDVPGFKTVEGRRSRDWTDAGAAEFWASETFGDDAFTTPELKSCAEIEKHAKRLKVPVPDHLWTWSKGPLKIAPTSDDRPALTSAQHDFSVIPDDTSRDDL